MVVLRPSHDEMAGPLRLPPHAPLLAGLLDVRVNGRESQVLGAKTTFLGDAGEHLRADLVTVVEGEDEIGPVGAGEDLGRTGRALDRPAEAEEGRQHRASTGGRPVAHAALKEMFRYSRPL